MSIDTRLLKIGAQIKLKRSWKLNQPIPLAEVEAIKSKPFIGRKNGKTFK